MQKCLYGVLFLISVVYGSPSDTILGGMSFSELKNAYSALENPAEHCDLIARAVRAYQGDYSEAVVTNQLQQRSTEMLPETHIQSKRMEIRHFLYNALNDKNFRVTRDAINAMGDIADQDYLDTLYSLYKHADRFNGAGKIVRMESVKAIGKIYKTTKDTSARAFLYRIIDRKSVDRDVFCAIKAIKDAQDDSFVPVLTEYASVMSRIVKSLPTERDSLIKYRAYIDAEFESKEALRMFTCDLSDTIRTFNQRSR